MSGTSLLHGGAPRRASGKHLTDHTEVALLWIDGALGLELGLDDVQRAGRDAGDEAASRASCERGPCRFMTRTGEGDTG